MSYLFSSTPWRKIHGSNGMSICSGIDTVATVYGTYTMDDFYPELTQEANADLIAKAPDMYRLLERTSVAILRNDQEKLQLIRQNIHNLFQEMGVTVSQRSLREVKRQEEQQWLEKAKKEIEEEDQAEEEATILQKYFGDDWDKYELYPADVGYHVLSKEDEYEEYFIFGETEGCVKPYYYNSKYWCKHDDSPAYVLPYRKSQPILHYEKAYTYYYNDIKEKFQVAGISDPDMKRIEYMLNGRTPRKLIIDYKSDIHEQLQTI